MRRFRCVYGTCNADAELPSLSNGGCVTDRDGAVFVCGIDHETDTNDLLEMPCMDASAPAYAVFLFRKHNGGAYDLFVRGAIGLAKGYRADALHVEVMLFNGGDVSSVKTGTARRSGVVTFAALMGESYNAYIRTMQELFCEYEAVAVPVSHTQLLHMYLLNMYLVRLRVPYNMSGLPYCLLSCRSSMKELQSIYDVDETTPLFCSQCVVLLTRACLARDLRHVADCNSNTTAPSDLLAIMLDGERCPNVRRVCVKSLFETKLRFYEAG